MTLLDDIQQGETKTLEFKKTLATVADLAKTIIAFANTSGGKFIISVKLWSEKQEATVPVIEDIGHVMASALKIFTNFSAIW